MPDRAKDYPAIAPRDWREPAETLLAFLVAETPEERDRLRPGIPRACREFRQRTINLKRDNYRSVQVHPRKWKRFRDGDHIPFFVDKDLYHTTNRLYAALNASVVDDDSRRRILSELERVCSYQPKETLT
jgi:hypothetical protein